MYYKPIPEFKPEEVIDYLRKSQSDDPLLTVEEVLEKHERQLDEWAEKHMGGKVPEQNKFREVVSGESLSDRPEMGKVLRLIESPKYTAVKCIDPQRLTRGDLEDMGRLMKLLKLTGTYVITMERIYDLRDEYDWDAFERELKRGNDYLKYVKKRLLAGRLSSVSAGNYIGNVAPYGFKKVAYKEGKKKCHTLEAHPEHAPVVQMIFDMYVNKNMGRTSICHTLDGMGIKPPKGEHWSPSAMKDMLENVHYIGKVKWNWRKTVEIVEDGQYMKTRPKNKIGEFLVFEGKHDGIISEELFQAAQEKQGRNHRAKAKTKVRNPLAGLVYCHCGRAMSFKTYMKNGEERAPARLLCDDQVHCGTGSCLYSEMIDRVAEILKQCIVDFEIRMENDEGDSMKLHANLIKQLEKKMKDLEAKELAQWERQAHPDESLRMPEEIFKKLNAQLLEEKEQTREALCKAHEAMPEPVDYGEVALRFHAALDALKNPEADAALQNRLLKACIERIDYKREKPERRRSTAKRVYVNGRRIKPDGIKPHERWTAPPIELDVKLRV